ncbi:MAG: transporter permease [Gammaproteobacteria bacterium]|jgi:putative ABC transport system permease protein|nr:transporter permease [Gammaproteobacteria bacterium]
MLLIRLAFRLLIREWRAGELYILLAALILAVACVASVGFATDRMQQAIEHQGAELLGGDIAVTSPKPMPESWSVYAKQLGLNTSISLEFASMLNAGEQYQLATVKAVDDNYPLLGVLEARTAFTAPANKMLRGPQPGEAWLEPRLWSTLQLKLNRLVTIGATALTASHVLAYEPDYSISWLNIAPRVLINHADLAKTRVLQPGSRAEYRLLVVGNSAALNRFILWLKPQLSASQKVINSKTGQTRLRNTLEQIEQYLKLASLICITLTGIAIATAIHHYTKRHYDTSSLLRCFGLKQRQIVGVYGYQLVILGFIGTLIGCLVGFLGQIILAKWVNASLQLILPAPHLYPGLIAIVTGLLAVFSFALPPLLELKQVPPLRILKREAIKPRSSSWLTYSLGGCGILTLLLLYTFDLKLTFLLAGSIGLTLFLLSLLAKLLLYSIQLLRPYTPKMWRYGLASLVRYSKSSQLQIITFGLIIMITMLLLLLRYDLVTHWQHRLPANTPNYFAINIAPTEVEQVKNMLAQAHLNNVGLYPMVRGRLTALNGKPILQAVPANKADFNAFHRELNLTWGLQKPPHNTLILGKWWHNKTAYTQLSVEAKLAEAMNAKLGDELTFTIGSESITGKITNLRVVDWYSFQPNFYVIFSPGALENMPVTYITSFYLPPDQEQFVNQLVNLFPSITLISIQQVLTQINRVIAKASLIIEYLLAFTLAISLLILFASLQAILDQRIYEGAIMRTLGISRKQLQLGLLAEFMGLGLLAGLVGIIGALVSSYFISHYLLHIAFHLNVKLLFAGLSGGILVIAIAGLLATRSILKQPPGLLIKLAT